MEVYNLKDLIHKQLISNKTGEIFSQSAILSQLFSFRKIFVHHEILSPGKRASSPHRHTELEEMVVVLEGFPTAHLDSYILQLQPGDCIGFKPDVKALHFIENTTFEDVRFLVICSSQAEDQVLYDI